MNKRPATMAELIAEEASLPRVPREAALVAGSRNRDDVMATPDGERMELVGTVLPQEAAESVSRGALIVWGRCGCGPTDCGQLEWVDPRLTRGAAPVFSGRGPGWLDLWRSASHEVVFGHGDAMWGAWD